MLGEESCPQHHVMTGVVLVLHPHHGRQDQVRAPLTIRDGVKERFGLLIYRIEARLLVSVSHGHHVTRFSDVGQLRVHKVNDVARAEIFNGFQS